MYTKINAYSAQTVAPDQWLWRRYFQTWVGGRFDHTMLRVRWPMPIFRKTLAQKC